MSRQEQIHKQKRRAPSTEELQAELLNDRERDVSDRIKKELTDAARMIGKIDKVTGDD